MKSLENLKPLSLFLLRLALGAIFINAGYPKLFTHPHESMQDFVHMGLPGYFAYIVGVMELFGGVMMVLGLFTRVAALLMAAEMALEVSRVHMLRVNPFAVGYYSYPLILSVSSFALATFGAGIASLDHAIFGEGGKSAKKSKSKN